MRSLLSAALLLAPVWVSAELTQAEDVAIPKDAAGPTATAIVNIPPGVMSPYLGIDHLVFDLAVGRVEEMCGYSEFMVNGQKLSQVAPSSERTTGGRDMMWAGDAYIDASWSFDCQYDLDEVHLSQTLRFTVHSINYREVPFPHNGFAVSFKQAGEPQILEVSDYPGRPAVPEQAIEADEGVEPDLEDELAELGFMVDQLNELRYHIAEKKESIRRHDLANSAIRLGDCDSVKCVFKALHHKMRCAAHKIYNKFHHGHHHHGHHPHHHHGHDKWRHGKGNHTGNHTHPHPPGKRPHHIPFCRFPPHHPPHGRPPHRKPHDGPPFDGPPPPLDGPPFDGPPPPFHGPPPPLDGPPPPPPPPFHGPPFHGPPGHHEPKRPERPERPDRPDLPGRPQHPERPDRPEHPPRPYPPHLNHFKGPGGPRYHHLAFKVLHTLKYIATGIIVACLLFALHRRCSPKRRAERRARREERRRHRNFKRARRAHAFRAFVARIRGHPIEDFEDLEKREALLANAENGLSANMGEEIVQFRNAAGVVGDIVTADAQRQPRAQPPRVSSLAAMGEHEFDGLMGHGEQLPAYEDDASSEMSSIADGIRYTPGSTEYDPSQSREGSVNDILGPDTKN